MSSDSSAGSETMLRIPPPQRSYFTIEDRVDNILSHAMDYRSSKLAPYDYLLFQYDTSNSDTSSRPLGELTHAITGFSGSSCVVLVLLKPKMIVLYVDGRYEEQAKQEVQAGSGVFSSNTRVVTGGPPEEKSEYLTMWARTAKWIVSTAVGSPDPQEGRGKIILHARDWTSTEAASAFGEDTAVFLDGDGPEGSVRFCIGEGSRIPYCFGAAGLALLSVVSVREGKHPRVSDTLAWAKYSSRSHVFTKESDVFDYVHNEDSVFISDHCEFMLLQLHKYRTSIPVGARPGSPKTTTSPASLTSSDMYDFAIRCDYVSKPAVALLGNDGFPYTGFFPLFDTDTVSRLMPFIVYSSEISNPGAVAPRVTIWMSRSGKPRYNGDSNQPARSNGSMDKDLETLDVLVSTSDLSLYKRHLVGLDNKSVDLPSKYSMNPAHTRVTFHTVYYRGLWDGGVLPAPGTSPNSITPSLNHPVKTMMQRISMFRSSERCRIIDPSSHWTPYEERPRETHSRVSKFPYRVVVDSGGCSGIPISQRFALAVQAGLATIPKDALVPTRIRDFETGNVASCARDTASELLPNQVNLLRTYDANGLEFGTLLDLHSYTDKQFAWAPVYGNHNAHVWNYTFRGCYSDVDFYTYIGIIANSTLLDNIHATLLSNWRDSVALCAAFCSAEAQGETLTRKRLVRLIESRRCTVTNAIAPFVGVSKSDLSINGTYRWRNSIYIGHSFSPITAAWEDAADPHFTSRVPDKDYEISRGENNECAYAVVDTGSVDTWVATTDITAVLMYEKTMADDATRSLMEPFRRMYTTTLRASIACFANLYHIDGLVGDARIKNTMYPQRFVFAGNVHKRARDVINESEFKGRFAHSVGHGIVNGGAVHANYPRFSTNGSDVIQEKTLFTVEPGVYVPGQGGCRIERLAVLSRTYHADKSVGNYMAAYPMTFVPFCHPLVDMSMMEPIEIAWYYRYQTLCHLILNMPQDTSHEDLITIKLILQIDTDNALDVSPGLLLPHWILTELQDILKSPMRNIERSYEEIYHPANLCQQEAWWQTRTGISNAMLSQAE